MANYFPFIFLVLFSCGNRSGENNSKLRQIDLSEKLTTKNFASDKIFDSIVYVPLETSDESLIKSIDKIEIDDSLVFLNDAGIIKTYNTKGKFRGTIGKIGRGPGEYRLSRDFTICRATRRVYVNTNWREVMIAYDYDGNYLFEIQKDKSCIDCAYNIEMVDSSTIACFTFPLYKITDQYHLVTLINVKTNAINYIESKLDFPKKIDPVYGKYGRKAAFTWFYHDTLNIWEEFSDTLFSLSSSGLSSRYGLNMGNHQFHDYFDRRNDDYLLDIINLMETETSLFIKYRKGEQHKIVCFDKHSGEVSELTTDGEFTFPPFKSKGVLIDVRSPHEMLAKASSDKNIQSIIEHMNDDSNPTLIIYYLNPRGAIE